MKILFCRAMGVKDNRDRYKLTPFQGLMAKACLHRASPNVSAFAPLGLYHKKESFATNTGRKKLKPNGLQTKAMGKNNIEKSPTDL